MKYEEIVLQKWICTLNVTKEKLKKPASIHKVKVLNCMLK